MLPLALLSNAPTDDKVYHVLFDSGSSNALIHKHIIPWNFIPIPSTDDLWIILFEGTTTSMALMALDKIRSPEFNRNMIVDKHPALSVDSTSLCYDIIFGADLEYENNLVQWMEYTNPLHNALDFFLQLLHISLPTHLNLNMNMIFFTTHMPTLLQHTFLMLNMNKPTFTMLPLIKPTFCLISNAIFSTS